MRPNIIIEMGGRLFLAVKVGGRIIKTTYIGRA
jgi:hypothetical protein